MLVARELCAIIVKVKMWGFVRTVKPHWEDTFPGCEKMVDRESCCPGWQRQMMETLGCPLNSEERGI